MTSILHIISQSPFSHPGLQQCLEVYRSCDSLLLLNNGVLASLISQPLARDLLNKTCYCLGDDLIARGLDDQTRIPGIKMTDYEGFVQLCTQYTLTQSWF